MSMPVINKHQQKPKEIHKPGPLHYIKIFVLTLLMFSHFSCYKNKYKCYECRVLVLNPYEVKTFERCTERVDTVQYKDADGNHLPVSCTEK
jgi:hypothetical protein